MQLKDIPGYNNFRKQTGNKILLDTNIWLIFLIGLINVDYISHCNRTSSYDKKDWNIIIRIIDKFKEIVTTPNIQTEVNNLGRQTLYGSYKQKFITLNKKFILESKEEVISSKSVIDKKEEIFNRLGLTDTGIEIISQNNNTEIGVLTDDMNLFNRLLESNIPVLNYSHIAEIIYDL